MSLAPYGTQGTFGGRRAVLGNYMPRYVRPMEDQIYSVEPHVHASASQNLQRLMALDFAYPVREEKPEPEPSAGTPTCPMPSKREELATKS